MKNNFKTIALLALFNAFVIKASEQSSGSPMVTSDYRTATEKPDTGTTTIDSNKVASFAQALLSTRNNEQVSPFIQDLLSAKPEESHASTEQQIEQICRRSNLNPDSIIHAEALGDEIRILRIYRRGYLVRGSNKIGTSIRKLIEYISKHDPYKKFPLKNLEDCLKAAFYLGHPTAISRKITPFAYATTLALDNRRDSF